MSPAPPQVSENILVRGVNWLGDAVMSTPALVRLRQACPHATITILTPAKISPLWQGHPAIDMVLAVGPTEGLFRTAARIRAGRYSVGVAFPNSPRSALELFLGRVPTRIGFARPWRTWALTHAVRPSQQRTATRKRSVSEIRRLIGETPNKPRDVHERATHQVLDYLEIVRPLDADTTPLPPMLAIADGEVSAVRKRFGAPDAKPLIGINPGAEYGPAKRWPEDRFAAAARLLIQQIKCHCWVFGAAGDVPIASRIAERLPGGSGESLAGRTSLRELCAALKACDVVLTNDTGPMHLAAAVGTPVVVPFGSTSPELTAPGWPPGQGHELILGAAPCAPCFRRACPVDFRCMTSITVEAVVAAVLRAWRAKSNAQAFE